MKKIIIILILIFTTGYLINIAPGLTSEKTGEDIMSVTGATPTAITEKASAHISLKIIGEVEKEYLFTGKTLNSLASTRIRTQEVSPEGKLVGTYAYMGIPALHILEGVAPKEPEKEDIFDRPLDMVITFISSSGNSVNFSYGEIIFVNDALPVTLAYDRKEIKSSKDPDNYDKNLYKDNIKGLRLISPRDSDTSRYLDDVTAISLKKIKPAYNKLPVQKKGGKCNSNSITCIQGNTGKTANFTGVDRISVKNWFRTGHGRGFKGIVNAEGYSLRSFLKKNFPKSNRENYFLFAACDGYRCLLSGREIFEHSDGESMLILGTMSGKKAHSGYMLAPVKDYFIDRDVWGLSHIMILDEIK